LIRIHLIIISLISSIYAVAMAPAAHADVTVTYEVASSDIAATNIEYFDLTGPKQLEHVPLPWRINATVVDPHSNATEVRADWGPAAGTSRWVTVRIYYQGSLLCEKTLDVGKEACYGGTSDKYGSL
jgi:hypothetical protein